ncbi:hypothetical protein [Clostridium sp. CS001]|nr:hypothetical protein [Clostridium sp. CS001]
MIINLGSFEKKYELPFGTVCNRNLTVCMRSDKKIGTMRKDF